MNSASAANTWVTSPAISMRLLKTEIASSVKASSVKKPSSANSLSLSQTVCRKRIRFFWNSFATARRFFSSNQKDSHPCTYSVGLYSLCGFSHSTSVPANNGVAPPPQKPTSTPALLSSRIAACVTEVPLPKRITVVLAIGIFQNKFSFFVSVK